MLPSLLLLLQEDEIRRAAEERERAENEEAEKWMNMISVEDTVRAGKKGGKGWELQWRKDQVGIAGRRARDTKCTQKKAPQAHALSLCVGAFQRAVFPLAVCVATTGHH